MDIKIFFYALLGGIIPALIWLVFWLREDKKNPEPKGLILKTFIFGMVSVILVLPFQKGVDLLFPSLTALPFLLWAILEEGFKFGAGYWGGLHSAEDNEPIDPMIYMITAALGFVAFENTLFILGPLLGENVPQSIVTGNLRFIGASLLHVVASGAIGAALSFSFYAGKIKKMVYALIGFGFAVTFHFIFNIMIILKEDSGVFFAFISVWLGAIALLLAFEKAKSIARLS